jgi:hypothetical protein
VWRGSKTLRFPALRLPSFLRGSLSFVACHSLDAKTHREDDSFKLRVVAESGLFRTRRLAGQWESLYERGLKDRGGDSLRGSELCVRKKRIFTVGFELPGSEFEYIEFDSDQTLLDADIILYLPTLGACEFEYDQEYAGKQVLSHADSFSTKARLDHWRNEIVAAVNAFFQR